MSILDAPVIQRETFGAKARRLARVAEVSNPVINAPWTVPAAWAPLTVYTQGVMTANGGSWFVSTTNGTSAGSGGPTVITDGDSHSDGTTGWTYYGGPTITASDANAPTLTTSIAGNAGDATLSNSFQAANTPNFFRIYGGYVASTIGSGGSLTQRIKTFNQDAVNVASGMIRVGFETDAKKFAIGFGNSTSALRIVIDGRYYSPSAILPATGATPNWLVFDFSSKASKQKRSIVVEGSRASSMDFWGVKVSALDQVWAPTTQDDVRMVAIADSLFAGSNFGPWLPGGSVPQRIGRMLGISDVWEFALGGTGYMNPAASLYTYGQRITEALTRNPDLWLFMGSTNDTPSNGFTAGQVQAAALATFQAIRAGGSKAPIIVLGVWPLNNAGVGPTEAAVQAAVTQFSDPLAKTFFIPIFADANLPWVTGAWNNSANTGSVNAPMYIGGDNTHPPDIGSAYLAQRAVRAIRTGVLPNLL